MQEALNTAFGTGVFNVSYDERQLKLSIAAESQSELRLFTDDEHNKYMCVRRFQDLTDTKTDRIVPIEVSNHTTDTLTNAVQEALNTAFGTGVFSVSYDEGKLKLSITAESQSELT